MDHQELCRFGKIDVASSAILEKSVNRHGLSARSVSKILKVARTIADLEHCEKIQEKHIREAIGFRVVDREFPIDMKNVA